jgi:hypothetical protein
MMPDFSASRGRAMGKLTVIVRWLGRLLGLLGFLFVVMFAVGEGVPVPWKQSFTVQFELTGTALMVTGLVAGWKCERTAAVLIAGGWLVFITAGRRLPPWPFTLFLIVAALYGYSGFRKRSDKNAKVEKDSL